MTRGKILLGKAACAGFQHTVSTLGYQVSAPWGASGCWTETLQLSLEVLGVLVITNASQQSPEAGPARLPQVGLWHRDN